MRTSKYNFNFREASLSQLYYIARYTDFGLEAKEEIFRRLQIYIRR
ncbi:hypothetical protein ACUXCC_002613 [Cytobacillus horneckiae]